MHVQQQRLQRFRMRVESGAALKVQRDRHRAKRYHFVFPLPPLRNGLCLNAEHVTEVVRVASAYGVPGTAALLVHDSNGRYLLSNHHVVFGGGAVIGDIWRIDAFCTSERRSS